MKPVQTPLAQLCEKTIQKTLLNYISEFIEHHLPTQNGGALQ